MRWLDRVAECHIVPSPQHRVCAAQGTTLQCPSLPSRCHSHCVLSCLPCPVAFCVAGGEPLRWRSSFPSVQPCQSSTSAGCQSAGGMLPPWRLLEAQRLCACWPSEVSESRLIVRCAEAQSCLIPVLHACIAVPAFPRLLAPAAVHYSSAHVSLRHPGTCPMLHS